jgi:glutamate dehydrogenase
MAMAEITAALVHAPITPPHLWLDKLDRLAQRALGGNIGSQLVQKYQAVFPPDYPNLVSPRFALQDILHLDRIGSACDAVSLLTPKQPNEQFRLHFYSRQQRYLDEYLPILENLHLRVIDQVQFNFSVAGNAVYIRSFTIQAGAGLCEPLPKLRSRLLQAINALLAGKAENDTLNKLLVLTGIDWQVIDVLRAYRNYLLQLGHQITSTSIHHALLHNPQVALGLARYFEARFAPNSDWEDPIDREELALSPIRLQLLDNMSTVTDLNDDRILRTLFNLIDATVRCNFYVRRNHADYFIAFKVNSLGVIDMPPPKPMCEIYVHAVDMQGIHLRAGKISRGGIRWSDRPDDFRTEILGLMQTQISKNALIIPTGAKGGFVVKNNGAKLDFKAAGKKAYLTLMHGILDLTDNYHDGNIISPPGIVAYDDPDPYLVVAADKGTASFSDIANAAAAEYRFWLGDAFASGGSQGYDHKALGITARGAWECVKRHFRELGRNIQAEPFTVIGIGSMDGDVFGNAMLLSPFIRLKAAFSGQHIFLDPNPSEGMSPFNERQRLFNQPGSSWDNYDRSLISQGGGVYLRATKAIPISPEIRQWLGIRYKTLDGETLIRYLLQAQVDLLWLGGIGTYVKASEEKNEAVGDRANDNVRVDASTLRALVVGEGANLGFTQNARIEYALAGGRINTDAVDNSAGVDTSDHEVNLKTLLTSLHKQGVIADYQALFDEMTDEVCELVLADNIAQSLCLSLEQLRNAENGEGYCQLAESLEELGLLDRAVESFPATKVILARPGQTLTRPELAVLMATSKRHLTQQLEHCPDFLTDDCCTAYLSAYFPAPINQHYQPYLAQHPLANAIKATVISNKVINQAGCGFLNLTAEDEPIRLLDRVACYLTFDRVLNADQLRQAIRTLDNKIPAQIQLTLLLQLENILAGFCDWATAHHQIIRPNQATLAKYRQYVVDYQAFLNHLEESQQASYSDQLSEFQQDGVPDEIATTIRFISQLQNLPFMAALAEDVQQPIATIAESLNTLDDILGWSEIIGVLGKLAKPDYWETKVTNQLVTDVQTSIQQLLTKILRSDLPNVTDYFALPHQKQALERYRHTYQAAISHQPFSLLPFVVLLGLLQEIAAQES